MLSTDDASGWYEIQFAEQAFELPGVTFQSLKILSTPDAVTPEIFTDAPGPYDLVVIASVYGPIHPSNWAPINAAIESRLANAFLLFIDGCEGCSPGNGSGLIGAINAAGMTNATLGSLLLQQGNFPLNTASPYSGSFAGLDPIVGGYVTFVDGVPMDNALYLAPGASIPPAGPLVDDVFGLLIPTTQSYGGDGACIFATVDMTLFTYGNGDRIGTSFLHAVTEPEGACGLPTRVSKVFSDSAVSLPAGNATTLRIMIENFSDADIAGANLMDSFPAPLQVAAAATTTCSGGTLTAAVGDSTVSLSNFTIPAEGSCQIEVPVIWPNTDAGVEACDGTSVTNTITPGIDFITPVGQINVPATASLGCSYVDVPPTPAAPAIAVPATRTGLLILLGVLVLAVGVRTRRRIH